LRERRKDISSLAYFFLRKYSSAMNKNIDKISDEAMEFLNNFDWPGNVRELENAIERAVVVGKTGVLELKDLPFSSRNIPDTETGTSSLAEIEKKHIEKILALNKWNIQKCSEILGIERATLYSKIAKYGLKKN
jgi:transcriptional regulator with PAS, ATPase and Fis domain